MSFVPAKCTNCGATLTVDQDKEAAICEHCGCAFIVEKAINNYVTNYNSNNTYTTNNEIHAQNVQIVQGKSFEDIADKLETCITKLNGEGGDSLLQELLKNFPENYLTHWLALRYYTKDFTYYNYSVGYHGPYGISNGYFEKAYALAPQEKKAEFKNVWDAVKYKCYWDVLLNETNNLTKFDDYSLTIAWAEEKFEKALELAPQGVKEQITRKWFESLWEIVKKKTHNFDYFEYDTYATEQEFMSDVASFVENALKYAPSDKKEKAKSEWENYCGKNNALIQKAEKHNEKYYSLSKEHNSLPSNIRLNQDVQEYAKLILRNLLGILIFGIIEVVMILAVEGAIGTVFACVAVIFVVVAFIRLLINTSKLMKLKKQSARLAEIDKLTAVGSQNRFKGSYDEIASKLTLAD